MASCPDYCREERLVELAILGIIGNSNQIFINAIFLPHSAEGNGRMKSF